MPLTRVSALVHDRIGSGLRPLFEKAQLPASMHAAFNAAIKAIRDGLADADDARLQRRMVERVLAACDSADSGDFAPLITLLRPFATEAAREEARLFCDEIADRPDLFTPPRLDPRLRSVVLSCERSEPKRPADPLAAASG